MTDPARFGSDGCTCRPFTRTDPPRYLQPGDPIDAHTSWQRGEDCPHHAVESGGGAEEAGVGWTQLEARAFNAVLPALRQAGEWLPLTARRAVARAALAAVREHLDIGGEEAWCKTCRRVWDGHRCQSDAEQQVAQVRKVIAERRHEVAERETDGMLPFGTPGASWCDAVTVTCDRIDYALKVFPLAGNIRDAASIDDGQAATGATEAAASPARNGGPTLREAAANDRRWPLEKAGE